MRRAGILVVCTANICRSPLMELALRRELDESRYEVASAGTRGWRSSPVDGMVRLEMARLGLDPSGFASRRLTGELIEEADLILTASRSHRTWVLETQPTALRRTFTMLEFAALAHDASLWPDTAAATSLKDFSAQASHHRSAAPPGIDIPDPYGGPPQVHRTVADLIVESSRQVAPVLNTLTPPEE